MEQIRVLQQKGIDCDVLYATSQSMNKHAEADGRLADFYNKLYGHNISYYLAISMRFYPEVLNNAVKNDYDIIHVNSGMVAPFGVLQPQRPLVTTFWGDDLLGDRLYGQYSKISKYCGMKSNEVIVRSQEMADELPGDPHIIPSGVDLEKFRPIDKLRARSEIGWSKRDKHVLFPYHPSQEKKRYPVAKELVQRVNNTLSQEVDLKTISEVAHEEMYMYYNAADVLLLPSLREGSPNTVKEAMACNLPIVSTDVGDVRERISEVKNSYVCKSEDELEESLVRVLSSESRSNGRKYVEPVSLDKMGDRIISIYEELL